jgi:hypothetical protein
MAGVQPNRHRYLLSLADELHLQSTRVRDLIGDAHWYYDGHHKEYLLVELLRRHLPSGMVASRGFVISATEPEHRSREQDVLVVDVTQEAPVFSQGGVIIVFPRFVRAAISVKTTMDAGTVADSIAGLNSVRDVAAGTADPRLLWCGAYYFEVDADVRNNPSLPYGHIARAMERNPVREPIPPPIHPCPAGPDLHCSAKDLAYKLRHAYVTDEGAVAGSSLLGYRCGGLGTALFLGELLDHLAATRAAADSDFSYFADGGGLLPLDEPWREIAPRPTP